MTWYITNVSDASMPFRSTATCGRMALYITVGEWHYMYKRMLTHTTSSVHGIVPLVVRTIGNASRECHRFAGRLFNTSRVIFIWSVPWPLRWWATLATPAASAIDVRMASSTLKSLYSFYLCLTSAVSRSRTPVRWSVAMSYVITWKGRGKAY